MNAEILLEVVKLREEPRPIAWIARKTGLDAKDVRAVLRIAGDPAIRSDGRGAREIDLDKYDQMEYLVGAGCSINEVVRTLGSNQATIKRWFPEVGVKQGSEEHKELARMGRKFREVERKRG